MSMIRRIKNNLFMRNCWMIVTRAKNLFRGKKQFAKCADNVIITPPCTFNNAKTFVLGRMYA